jgi:hypothetical protein
MSTANDVFKALTKRTGFEVVQPTESPNQLRIVGRLPPDALSLNKNNYVILAHRLLAAMEERPWKVDISEWYLIKPETKRLVKAQRLIFQGELIARCYDDIINVISTSPTARVDVTEVPLAGVSPDRNNTSGGRRGAGPMGSVAVGAAALRIKQMGG